MTSKLLLVLHPDNIPLSQFVRKINALIKAYARLLTIKNTSCMFSEKQCTCLCTRALKPEIFPVICGRRHRKHFLVKVRFSTWRAEAHTAWTIFYLWGRGQQVASLLIGQRAWPPFFRTIWTRKWLWFTTGAIHTPLPTSCWSSQSCLEALGDISTALLSLRRNPLEAFCSSKTS